jgi:radical SAM superfamily enzyme YgiQ (UPF0313 family)
MLVNPPMTQAEAWGALTEGAFVGGPPLSLLYLGAVTREHGHRTRILDCLPTRIDHQSAARRIIEDHPTHVGFTATTVAITSAAAVAEEVKRLRPETTTIIGGTHVTAVPDETMRRFPAFDLAVVGEGEGTLVEVLQAADDNSRLDSIPGLVIRTGAGLVTTPGRSLMTDLESLPMPAWDLLDGFPDHYQPPLYRLTRLPVAWLVTARGCPYHGCTFCDRSLLGTSYRPHDLDQVFAMIRTLVDDHGIRGLIIYDEDFLSNRERLRRFCDRMRTERLDLRWACNARTTAIRPDTVRMLKDAGCRAVSFGIESAAEEVLAVYRKKIDLDGAAEALRLCRRAGIVTNGFFMIGGPLETENTVQRTLDWAKRVPLDFMNMAFFTPFPGAEITRSISDYGTVCREWDRLSPAETAFVPSGMTEETLANAYRRAILGFYLRPSIAWTMLRHLKNPNWWPRVARGVATLAALAAGRSRRQPAHGPKAAA